MEIAVFGAGAAGLMTAIALNARGHRCRIYERSRQSHEAGMGFILMPEGLELMRSYGVHLSAVPLHTYRCRNSAGEILLEEAMPAGAGGARRRDLIAALLAALPAETITFGAELDGLEFDRGGRVTTARVALGVGVSSIQADLFVGADGIHSRARHALFPDWPATPAPVMEIVGCVRCDTTIKWTGQDFNKFHALSGGLAFGVLPVDADHVVWYLQFDAKRFAPPPESDGPEARRVFVRRLAGDWAHPVPSLIDHTDFSDVYLWRPLDTDLVPYFHQGNLVLVGDAAHPLSPFTSQGVSSAIADADALARALASETEMERALTHYSTERRADCAPYISQGRDLTRQFLSPRDAASLSVPIAR
jgi:2-polyprenyl-6-methoxyphenol hydroxylase-like FAD-dependent oxidoreductase